MSTPCMEPWNFQVSGLAFCWEGMTKSSKWTIRPFNRLLSATKVNCSFHPISRNQDAGNWGQRSCDKKYLHRTEQLEEVDNIGKVRGNKCMEVGKQFLRCRYFLKTTHKWNHLIQALWLGNHLCPPVRHHYYATAVQLMVSSFDTTLA